MLVVALSTRVLATAFLASTTHRRLPLLTGYYYAFFGKRRPNWFVYANRMSTSSSSNRSDVLDIATNLQSVQDRIRQACVIAERNYDSITLVAVSKTKPIELLQAAYDAGQRVLGENYPQELVSKLSQMPNDVLWHMIGPVQSNKVNLLVQAFAGVGGMDRLVIETVATTKLANKLQTAVVAATGNHQVLNIMIQINTSGEDSKSGVEPAQALELAQHIVKECPNLRLMGVMTIGGMGDVNCFTTLIQCREELASALHLSHLEVSMGMSGDFEIAIAHGATTVRVGSTIFGEREYSNKE